MIAITVHDLAEVTGGTPVGVDPQVTVTAPASHSSREIAPGGLFVALPGEHADGHDYVADAVRRGAAVCLTARDVPGAPCLVVADPLAALATIGRLVIDRLPGLTVIAMTGSQGKTSTKDIVAQLLPADQTVAPPGSFNNEIGVPVTVTRCDESTRYLVVEMGARGIGHINYLTSITPPRIGIELNVGSSHLGEFGSREAIAQAKGELVEALPAGSGDGSGGVAVLNLDDPFVAAMAQRTQGFVYGFSQTLPDAPVRAEGVRLDSRGCAQFTLQAAGLAGQPGITAQVTLPLVGAHQVPNALAAAAAAHAAGIEWETIAQRLGQVKPLSKWRMEVSTVVMDGREVIVVNDAYNANPDSMRAAFEAVRAIGDGAGASDRIAVLGQMLELGENSDELHARAGAQAAAAMTHVIAVGGDGSARTFPVDHVAQAYIAHGGSARTVRRTNDPDTTWHCLREFLNETDRTQPAVVLVKASRAVGLEAIAARLLAPTGEQA